MNTYKGFNFQFVSIIYRFKIIFLNPHYISNVQLYNNQFKPIPNFKPLLSQLLYGTQTQVT